MMRRKAFTIGVVAPAAPVNPELVLPIQKLAHRLYGNSVEVRFHRNCFQASGHFAGPDVDRAAAVIEFANSDDIDAIWFGRGGYGTARVAEAILNLLQPGALTKPYLGYSDIGALLAGLYNRGATNVAHGPMVQDICRKDGNGAVERALRWLVERSDQSLEANLSSNRKVAAFNLTVLCSLIGTQLEPNLVGHELLVEEVSEHMYRIDRCFGHLFSSNLGRKLGALRLGRCTNIILNEPDFLLTEEQIAIEWCERTKIPYLGRADIAHDAENKVVPFGKLST